MNDDEMERLYKRGVSVTTITYAAGLSTKKSVIERLRKRGIQPLPNNVLNNWEGLAPPGKVWSGGRRCDSYHMKRTCPALANAGPKVRLRDWVPISLSNMAPCPRCCPQEQNEKVE